MSETYDYKDSKVYINWMDSFFATQDYPRKWICPICEKKIIKGYKVAILINNQKYFPNAIIHEECFHKEVPDDTFSVIEWKSDEYKDWKNNKEWMF